MLNDAEMHAGFRRRARVWFKLGKWKNFEKWWLRSFSSSIWHV